MIPNQLTYNIQSNLLLCLWCERYRVCYKILIARCSAKNDHYAILKLKSNATCKEIKHSYYELSKIYHPDVNSSEEAVAVYRKICDAYRVLGNYRARKKYDLQISMLNKKTDHKNFKSVQRNFAKEKSTFPTVGTTKHFDFDEWWHHHYSAMQKDKMQKHEEFSRKISDFDYASLWPWYFVIISTYIFVIIMYSKG